MDAKMILHSVVMASLLGVPLAFSISSNAATPGTGATMATTRAGGSAGEALTAWVEAVHGGRTEDVRRALYVDHEQFINAEPSLADLAIAQAAFEKAMTERFGSESAGYFFPSVDSARAAWATGPASTEVDGAEQKLVMMSMNRERILRLSRTGGAWRVPASAVMSPLVGNDVGAELPRRIREMVVVFEDGAIEVRNGTYKTADEAIAAVSARARAAQQGMNNQ